MMYPKPSLRSSERGLKLKTEWLFKKPRKVAPFVGAWIEIKVCYVNDLSNGSLRSSERGLK